MSYQCSDGNAAWPPDAEDSGCYHLSWNEQYLITLASSLHDIGKIGIYEKILNKPGRLTTEEFEKMKRHTVIGEEILKSLGFYQNEQLVRIAAVDLQMAS